MNRIEFAIADQKVAVFVNQTDIVQVYCNEQAVPLEESGDLPYVILGEQIISFDTSRLSEGGIGVSANNEPWQWVELPHQVESKRSIWGLAALGLKLFKSAKVVKAALAGASLAAYAWLFTWEFAVAMVACLVIHEYGHVVAMRYFKIKTKGFYLIPFVGGMALTDEKITTRWQDVVISIMGPVFGLLASIVALLLYYVTDLEMFAGVAVLSALLNIFNLLPMLPLDGGHVLKSVSFSSRSWVGLVVCLGGVGLGLWLSYTFGLYLLVLFLALGTLEIMFEWRARKYSHLLPLDRYGQVVSVIMYLAVMGGLMGIIYSFADSANPILSLPLQILSS